MFKQLRDLFRRPEPVEEILELSFDDLPAWLDARAEEIGRGLSDAVRPSEEAIDGALDHLKEAVARLETAEGDEEVHPRLRDISKKALPGFTKSITQVLSREPSGDPEAFYATAAETLKGVLKAMKGQGKYLSSAYPEEMKEIRTAARDLGREINTMTEAITRARGDRRQVEDARQSYESLVRIREEYAAASGQVQEYGTALAEAKRKILEVEEDLDALKQHPDYARKQQIEEKIRDLDALDEETGREIAALRVPATHLFRKAEKVAGRTGDSATAAAIGRVLDAYTDSLPEGEGDPASLTEAVMPATLTMIRQGDLILKNQDEVRLFSDPETLPAGIRRIQDRQGEVRKQRETLQETRAALPCVTEEQRLLAALTELRRDREAKSAARTRAESQRETLQTSYASERERLWSRTAALAGRDVELKVPDLPSPE
jgi:chromosome segregation ATPase